MKSIIIVFTLTIFHFHVYAQEKPNIIFIFADDQAFSTIHALGNEEVITPTLDKLVNEGATFTHAYNMGAWNGAVCMASRAMMITGRSVWRAHALDDELKAGKKQDETWPKLMEKAGYNTYMSGKWHVAAPAPDLFMTTHHIRPGMPKDTEEAYNRPKSRDDKAWQPWDKKFGGFWEGGTHWSEVLRNDALTFIEDATRKEEPFFMYLAFNAAHDPRQSPKEYVDKYPVDEVKVPENFMPEYPYNEAMGSGRTLRDERLAPFPRTEYAVQVHRKEYYALITHMDEQIRQILEALEKSGKQDNTYIFFTADHGLACGEHGLIGKQNMFDHSIRVPLMVLGPDIPEGKKVEADVYLQDVMASGLELAGIKKPKYVEFNSLMDMARGRKEKSKYKSIYGGYIEQQRMIRKDGLKLIVYPEIDKVLLYNVEEDPKELHNLAEDPAYKKKIKRLFKDLLKLQKKLDDTLNIKSTYDKVVS
ncbi:sulfatase-like hydrolase/transferase [Catalinimonas sp. 4WD22]|uniref:sulfatase-like hydrolase/transferase n=1 Tax=Catalinimonas locisalis TaxID=3133978 RepID=UPI0031012EF8